FIEARCLEGSAVAGRQAQAVGDVHAPGDTAGVLAAEGFVIVVAGRKLQVVASERTLVLHERGLVVATRIEGVEAAAESSTVARPVRAHRQQLAGGERNVGLYAGAVAMGGETIGRG